MTSQHELSRRSLLKGLGIGTLATTVGGRALVANAQISGASADAIAFYRYNLGDLQITAIKDGFSLLDTSILATGDNAGEVTGVLEAKNLPTDQLLNTFNIMMISAGEDIFLVDTGFGPGSVENTGKLIPTMELLGMSPADVTGIIGTHWHPDHTNGLSMDGTANFPNAAYYFPQTEYDFVQANAEQFTGGAAAAIAPYADSDQLSLYADGDEIIPGITAMAAPGHTPGHTALMMTSGGNSMLHMVDTAISAFVHVPNPTFAVQFDADPATATETRVSLLGMAADEGIPVIGYHFPFPGIGLIARDMDDNFAYVPYN